MVIKTLPEPTTTTKRNATNGFLSQKYKRSQSASLPLPIQSDISRLPDAADLRKMCIITKTDLNRIHENLNRRQREKDAIQNEIQRKQELAARSAQITKNWPNTIAGARERKLEIKRLREEEEEQRRKLLDVEEEKLAAERRREQIEKAKQLKYYETDRIRTFHSALLHTEVLKERELQLEMKKNLDEMRRNDENDVRQRYQDAENEFNKNEQEKKDQKFRERATLSQYHLAQIDRKQTQLAEEQDRNRQEGEEYRRLAEQHALEHMELERYRKLTQKDVKNMYDKALDDKQKVRQMEKELDEEEDEELRIYADAKKKIARMRREKELQAHQEKQDARDHMIGYLGSLQKRAEADYDSQMIRARIQREAKEMKEEQEKLDKQRKMQDSINQYRHETIKRRQVEKEIEEREDLEMREKKAETDKLFQLYQQEKDKKRRDDAQILSQTHLQQAHERKDRERVLKSGEFDETQMDKHTSEIERQQYQDYAGRVIAYMEENGRNTYPMKKVYNEEMKRFDQWSQGFKKSGTPNSEQGKKSFNDTKKHLGFQWDTSKK